MADYIDRDAYMRYLSSRKAEFVDDYGKGWSAGIDTAIRACEKFPSAYVAPVRHGSWLPQVVLGQKAWDCSECKTLGSPQWRWCPVCGAKMDGERKENENV